jgi:hypothetical protein
MVIKLHRTQRYNFIFTINNKDSEIISLEFNSDLFNDLRTIFYTCFGS